MRTVFPVRRTKIGDVEATKRVLNLHLERAVLATIDFAIAMYSKSLVGLPKNGVPSGFGL